MSDLAVHPIHPDRLSRMHADGHDDLGNPLLPWAVQGWEPLRCCLRTAAAGDDIALVAYRPAADRSPWSEVGPVFVHLAGCPGYVTPREPPAAMRHGPKVLRAYYQDGSLDYDDTAVIDDDRDLEPDLRAVLAHPEVSHVHVRAYASQCFTYAVRMV